MRVARFASLVAPQLALSAAVLWAFHRWLYYPSDLAWFHLPVLAALQCGFFLAWTTLAGRNAKPPSGFTRWYAASLFVKSIAFNAVYVASFAANRFWGDNFTWANVGSTGKHLQGFAAAFGPIVYWAAGAAVLLIALYAAALQRLGPLLVRHLRWAAGLAALDAVPHGSRNGAPAASSAAVAVAAAVAIWMPLSLGETARIDPLFSFWFGVDQRSAPQAQSALDHQTREQYPIVPNFRRKNVVIVVVDCLRQDHLPMFGYPRNTTPFLAGLHESGQTWRSEYSVSVGNDSPQGIFAVLTSRHPEKITAANFKIYEALQRQGYRTHAIVAGDHSYLGGLRRLYGSGLDVFVDGIASANHTVNDDALILDALEQLPPSDGTPAFFFFHLMSVHVAGARDAVHDEWHPCLTETEKSRWLFGGNGREVLVNTYDNSIRQADDYIRRIWSTLGAKGYLNDYVAAITGDHGEGLGERGHYGHTQFLHFEDVLVPIIFVDSERLPYGPMPLASQIDIAPTLLSRLGLPLPQSWEGQSLHDGPPRTVAFMVSRRKDQWRAVIKRETSATYKYLFFGPLAGKFEERLYELRSDPQEEHDVLAATAPEIVQRLRGLAAEHFQIELPSHVSAVR